jgi:hypothetical protein
MQLCVITKQEVLRRTNSLLSFDATKTPWPQSASELYRPSDRSLSTKSVPTFANRGCHVVSVTDPYGRILDFLDLSTSSSILLMRLSGPRSRPLLLRKSGSAGNRTLTTRPQRRTSIKMTHATIPFLLLVY